MMHKARCSTEEVPYNFSRSSIKFLGHTGWKIDDLGQIWARLLGRSQLSNPSDLPCFNLTLKIQGKAVAQGLIMVQHPIDSHPFHSILTLPFLRYSQLNWGQGHGWGQSSKSQSRSAFLSTHNRIFVALISANTSDFDFLSSRLSIPR